MRDEELQVINIIEVQTNFIRFYEKNLFSFLKTGYFITLLTVCPKSKHYITN